LLIYTKFWPIKKPSGEGGPTSDETRGGMII